MLIQFRTENHRSLRDEQALSMVAASLGDPGDERLLRPTGLPEPLLPAVALYGANASGKTNVLHALGFMRDAVLHSYRQWEPEGGVPTEPFALSQRKAEPSLYEVDIIAEGIRFSYGFVASVSGIEEEWLFAWPHGHKQTWFEREGEDFKFSRSLAGDNEAIRKLTRSNSLFLSAAAQNNHLPLMPLFRWFRLAQVDFRRARTFFNPYSWMLTNEMLSRQLTLFPEEHASVANERRAILDLLRTADTGIIDVRVEELEGEAQTPGRPSRRRTRILFRHKSDGSEGDGTWLPLSVESAGTVALIELAPRITRALQTGGLVCIDEMEASLHPMLALSLLQLFHNPQRNQGGAQLLFTTHDTNLLGTVLGSAPLRRDQIWFTEKDDIGATHLYPLTDFHPRKQENLERGYLQGRYGAIPFLGDLAVGIDS